MEDPAVPKKILIVEDDEDLQVLYGLYLQGLSYQIRRAYDGLEALQLVAQEKPDLIILDMIMPVMDGEEFLTRLRTERGVKDVPVIIASVNEKIPPKVLALGNISSTLKKPFTVEVLINRIQEAFSEKSF